MGKRNWKPITLALVAIFALSVACGSTDGGDQQVRSLVEPADEQGGEVDEPETIEEPAEPTPIPPTATPEIEGLIKEGTHLVGTDILPGIYVGLAGESLMGSCYWERLNALSGEFEAIIANNNSEGLYYIEILETDFAFTTACELLPIDKVPARESFLTTLSPGTYLIGRDIEAGLYKGEAGDMCYWERMSCVQGEFDCIIANDNAEGQFYVEISPSDYAFKIGCEASKSQ